MSDKKAWSLFVVFVLGLFLLGVDSPNHPTPATDDTVPVGSGVAWVSTSVPSCSSAGNALQYNTSTNAFMCTTITAGDGGTPPATQLLSGTVYTVPGGTAVNDFVYSTGADTASDSNATSSATMPGIGFVQVKPSGTTATLVYAGELGGFSGLTAGSTYFASASTPGGITATAPNSGGNIVQKVGVARNTTTLVIEISLQTTSL